MVMETWPRAAGGVVKLIGSSVGAVVSGAVVADGAADFMAGAAGGVREDPDDLALLASDGYQFKRFKGQVVSLDSHAGFFRG
jgi:hypothetical protein